MNAKLVAVAIVTALLTTILLSVVFTRSAYAADPVEVSILERN